MKTVLDVITDKLADQAEQKGKWLCEDKAEDFADYRYVCGQLRGLWIAQSIVDDLSRAQLEDDDYE